MEVKEKVANQKYRKCDKMTIKLFSYEFINSYYAFSSFYSIDGELLLGIKRNSWRHGTLQSIDP